MYVIIILVEWPPIGKQLLIRFTICFHGTSKYLIINLVFFPPRFLEWESFSECAFS